MKRSWSSIDKFDIIQIRVIKMHMQHFYSIAHQLPLQAIDAQINMFKSCF